MSGRTTTPRRSCSALPHEGYAAYVWLSVDEKRAEVKAEVRLAAKLVSQHRESEDDGAAIGVLGAADGWEQLPPG
ncbi:hypothetical protein Q2K19_27795 [Micromonospora soli]|uniref:hypothetical protein n=1 Tax=Micromonospora sp. NBRC 110009 TaxID=3061627 RepID=UPI002671961A|nr:hypothetical protein [Micromonospora sp. NBRC 110009]WKT97938.1 hypothetical protein Q2K19_27795 [Micromonospora sp. NBRC 110009]